MRCTRRNNPGRLIERVTFARVVEAARHDPGLRRHGVDELYNEISGAWLHAWIGNVHGFDVGLDEVIKAALGETSTLSED